MPNEWEIETNLSERRSDANDDYGHIRISSWFNPLIPGTSILLLYF